MCAPRDCDTFFGLSGDEIYRRYFRTGPYTHLCLHPVKEAPETGSGKGLEVRWIYAFADLGQCFEIDRHFVVYEGRSIYDVQTGLWANAENDEYLRDKLFDHYRPFLRGVYDAEGILWAGKSSNVATATKTQNL
jgi:hypothetical protein